MCVCGWSILSSIQVCHTILMNVKKCLAAFTFGNAREQIRSGEDGKAVQGLAMGEI